MAAKTPRMVALDIRIRRREVGPKASNYMPIQISNMQTCSAAANTTNKTSTEFIRTSCGATTYPQVCFKSLSTYASAIQSSHYKLAETALNVSLRGARSTSAMVSKLLRQEDMKPNEAAAVKDCVEEIGESIDELQQSLKAMGDLGGDDVEFEMSNMKTWVSAALTDEDTCINGMEEQGVNEKVKKKIRKSILGIVKLTSNALALINSLTST
ncbi:hypothetical protein HHK36_028716 [Tetracentron sinense]|uniref:Pectinesterase inhibitor domain-containing protein n=1 Tax=Tetracentron sinense TaxID=13715 RepID=A0A834YBK4_TETSI|nr:hypothetical protein HHK36_028716 [Tetracentron sinense]